MKTTLIKVSPLNTVTNARVDLYVGDAGNAQDLGAGGIFWEPAIIVRPQLSIELLSPDLNGSIQVGKMHVEFNLGLVRQVQSPERLYWNGAAIALQADGVLEGPTASPEFIGYVTAYTYDKDTRRLALDCKVSTKLYDKNLLTKQFGGGGGIDGDAGFRGTLLPAAFGTVKNIEPIWFDATRNIGMLDGYDNTLSIDWLGEGLASFGPRVADYATYALLAAAIDAAAVAPGEWATCVAKGLVGLGAPPAGRISVHATFGYGTPGTWITRILETHAGLSGALIDTVAMAAFDAELAALLPNDGASHYWTSSQRQILDLLSAIGRCYNGSVLATFQGLVSITRAVVTAPVAALDLNGGSVPPVLNWKQNAPTAPAYLVAGRSARPASVFTFNDVNYKDTIVDRGLYNSATIYQAGNIVWLGNGEEHLYINDTPSAGHLPPVPTAIGDHDAYWECLKLATTYTDGTPIDDVQPRDPGATQNDDGANMLKSPVLLTRLSLDNGAVRDVAIGAAGRAADRYRVLLGTAANSTVWWDFEPTPCTPGETLYYHHYIKTDVTTVDAAQAGYETYDILGNLVATIQLPETKALGSAVIGAFADRPTSFIVPAGVAAVRPFVKRALWSGVGTFFVGEPYLGRSQPGADVTLTSQIVVIKPSDAEVQADYLGAVTAGQLPRPLGISVTRGGTVITLDDEVSYALTNLNSNLSGAGTLTVDNTNGSATKGTITLDAPLPGSGNFDIVVTVSGNVQPPQTVQILLKKGGSSGSGSGAGGATSGSGAIDSYGLTTPGTSFVEVRRFEDITIPSGKTVAAHLSTDYNYYISPGEHIDGKWQYAVAGTNFATPTDFAAAVSGTDASLEVDPTYYTVTIAPGSITCNQSASPAAGTYDIRFVGKSGAGTTLLFANSSCGWSVS